jgi:hypothetical protein
LHLSIIFFVAQHGISRPIELFGLDLFHYAVQIFNVLVKWFCEIGGLPG